MNITEIQAALKAIGKRAVTVNPRGGWAYISIREEEVYARLAFYSVISPAIEGRGETPEEAIANLNAALDERDPKLLAATLGVDQL